MTASGDSRPDNGGVDEPDWIDQILERATLQVEGLSSEDLLRPDESESSVGDVVPTSPVQTNTTSPAEVRTSERAPVQPAVTSVADELAEIRWADTRDVTPASTPIVPTTPATTSTPMPATPTTAVPPALTAEAVGRSAWDHELSDLDGDEPEGWDQLSWQDLDQDASAPPVPVEGVGGFGQLIREWGPVLFAALAIALFSRLVLVQAYHIPSDSMVPTLETGDRVVVNRLSYQFGEIERGQVVVFAKPLGTEGENDLIKRVVGLPGETIRFADNKVYINNQRVDEPYLAEQDSTRPRLTIPGCAQTDPAPDLCVVPEGHVFVMGDNRLRSSDSRVFGPIETDSVVGRAFWRVWPLNNLGQL